MSPCTTHEQQRSQTPVETQQTDRKGTTFEGCPPSVFPQVSTTIDECPRGEFKSPLGHHG
jgi:hypothetical protein